MLEPKEDGHAANYEPLQVVVPRHSYLGSQVPHVEHRHHTKSSGCQGRLVKPVVSDRWSPPPEGDACSCQYDCIEDKRDQDHKVHVALSPDTCAHVGCYHTCGRRRHELVAHGNAWVHMQLCPAVPCSGTHAQPTTPCSCMRILSRSCNSILRFR